MKQPSCLTGLPACTQAADCLNLREMFGNRWRIGWDPAYDPRGVPKEKRDPWMMTIPCRLGTIYPHGGEMLALEIDRHPRFAKLVAALPGVILHQDGQDEKTFLFPVGMFDLVAAIVRPKQRPKLTDEELQKRTNRINAFNASRKAPKKEGLLTLKPLGKP